MEGGREGVNGGLAKRSIDVSREGGRAGGREGGREKLREPCCLQIKWFEERREGEGGRERGREGGTFQCDGGSVLGVVRDHVPGPEVLHLLPVRDEHALEAHFISTGKGEGGREGGREGG